MNFNLVKLLLNLPEVVRMVYFKPRRVLLKNPSTPDQKSKNPRKKSENPAVWRMHKIHKTQLEIAQLQIFNTNFSKIYWTTSWFLLKWWKKSIKILNIVTKVRKYEEIFATD